MLRRFNFTGRLRIRHEDITITLTETDEGTKSFYADLNLSRYGLPEDAEVWIEAYDRHVIMRFQYGTVGDTGRRSATTLSAFGRDDGFRFRVKIVDRQSGKLLALARSISPIGAEGDTDRSLLRVALKDLGHVPWHLDIDKHDGATLFINLAIEKGIDLARSDPSFQALSLPVVVESIIDFIFSSDEFDLDAPDESPWMHDWISFFESLPRVPALDPETLESDHLQAEWKNLVTQEFCRQNNLLSKLKVVLGEADQ